MDVLTSAQRSRCMSAIRNKDTKPELIVRRLVHSLGYRYRLHRKDLPGRPDLTFPARRKVIFVHGCFWHRHRCRKGRSLPATRVGFWQAKLDSNKHRDADTRQKLRRVGWQVLVVWECQTAAEKLERLAKRISQFLEGG
ncbi:MAG TPA: very short patch repair endonuclease [Phycisphaerae bacterium]|nr:very short patch repair endonuclease [Phycisphaerae bacterium]